MNRGKELVKNTTIIFMGKFATQFLSFFLLPIYSKFLATEDYGTIDLILTYISLLVPVITIQHEMSTFRFLIDARNNKKEISKIITTSLKNIIICMFIFVIFFGFINYFVNFKYPYYIMLNIIVCIFSNMLLQISRGLGKNINYSIASFITGLVTFIINIVLICLLNVGAKGILISMSIGNVICIFYLFVSLKLYNYINFKKIDKKLSKEMLKYSLPLVPNGISWWFISVSDRTIVSIFLGLSANGIYAVANKFPSIITSLLNIFNLSWSESTSLHIKDKDRDVFFSGVVETILRLFSSLSLILIAVLPFAYDILIGKNYFDSYNYIPIFLIGTLCNCIICVYSAIYIGLKKTKKVASTSIMSAAINLIINLLFIRKFGLYAASLSTTIAFFSMMIYRHFDLKKTIAIKYDFKLLFSIILIMSITIIMYYINNFYLNFVNLLIVLVFSIIVNKKTLDKVYTFFINKKRIMKLK